MAEHTPSPWVTDPEVNHQAVLGPDGFMVADCSIVSLRANGPTNETCAANACLIATAPALLAKCEKVIAWLDWLANHAESRAAKNDRFPSLKETEIADAKNYRATANDIRAVVAKAKGEGEAA
ncbi:hypothetical protein LCGC14_1951910 [marine sediment metagenome]|uniref:Uncharacterized protein n=1 Tax=marine sediment metagenome TaxID=412755 RepID=A0A0F9FHF5_9ZZZZ